MNISHEKEIINGKEVDAGIVELADLKDYMVNKTAVFYILGVFISGRIKDIKIANAPTSMLFFELESNNIGVDAHSGIWVKVLNAPLSYWIEGFDAHSHKLIVVERKVIPSGSNGSNQD